MEKILQQILEELKGQGKRLGRLEEGQEAQGQELKALGTRMGRLEEGQQAQGEKLDKMQTDLTQLSVHVEGEITEKIGGLYDDREIIKDKLERIEEKQLQQDARLEGM